MDVHNTATRQTRRKNYFIDKKFQANFIVKFCLFVAGTGILILAALYMLTRKATTVSFVNSRVVVQGTADFLFPVLIQTFIVGTVIVSIATIFFALFISHRIAGPAYRFKKVISSLKDGDFSGECRIRRNDSLQDVAAALSDMMANVRKLLTAVNGCLAKLKGRLETMQSSKGADEAQLTDLKKEVSELDKTLRRFKF